MLVLLSHLKAAESPEDILMANSQHLGRWRHTWLICSKITPQNAFWWGIMKKFKHDDRHKSTISRCLKVSHLSAHASIYSLDCSAIICFSMETVSLSQR